MFDPVHAAKSLRNKDFKLGFSEAERNDNVERNIVSYDYIQLTFDTDKSRDSLFRFLPKLTDAYVRPDKVKKMKVSCYTETENESMSQFILTQC